MREAYMTNEDAFLHIKFTELGFRRRLEPTFKATPYSSTVWSSGKILLAKVSQVKL